MPDLGDLKAAYSFIDTPYDLLYLCQGRIGLNNSITEYPISCMVSRVLGIVSAYIFPIIGTFGLVSNFVIFYIFVFKFQKKSRQTVLLTFLAVSDFCFILLFGWLWLFPAKGLPYASGGTKYLFIVNVSDQACRVYRCFYMTCLNWIFGAFVLVCIDRMLAIYFPMKMRWFGYRSALVGSFVTFVICVIVNNIYTGFIKWRKISSKIYCTLSTGDNHDLGRFLNVWRVLCSYSGVLSMVLIILINISLIWKIRKNQSLVKNVTIGWKKKEKKEIKATIIVFILSVCFLIGTVPNVAVYSLANAMENMVTDAKSIKDDLQMIYNLGDIGTQLFLWMESINIIIYYVKIRQFQVEFDRMIRIGRTTIP